MDRRLYLRVQYLVNLQRVTERKRSALDGGDLSTERQDAFFEAWQERELQVKQGMIARMRDG